jgi:glycosyltransferase involved in cell wall biosynthesis
LGQTYQDFELLILDDKSPDNSREVIETYRNHPKVSTIVYNQENGGSTFKQWEKGIAMAKGDYIWIAESDDWCEPTLLETLINGLLKNPSAGIAYCQSCYFYEPNRIKSLTFYPFFEKLEPGKEFIRQHMLDGNSIVNASMAIWKRSVYDSIDKVYTGFKFCGDWLFYISILQQTDIFVSGKVLNYFRNHDKDVSTIYFSTGKNLIENIRLYEVLYQRNIIDKSRLKQLITRQYLIFTGAKTGIAKEYHKEIESAFGQHLTLNETTRFYYRSRLWLYNLKKALVKSK